MKMKRYSKLPYVLTKISVEKFNENPCKYYTKGYDIKKYYIDTEICKNEHIGNYMYHITPSRNLFYIYLNGLSPARTEVWEKLGNLPRNFKVIYFASTVTAGYETISGVVNTHQLTPLRVKTSILKNKLYLDPENPNTQTNEAELNYVYMGKIKSKDIEYAIDAKIDGANMYAKKFIPISEKW